MKSNVNHSIYECLKSMFSHALILAMICMASPGRSQVVAVEDEIFTYDNVDASGDLSTNDLNPGNATLTYTLLSNTNSGILIVNPDGSWTFSPNPDASAFNTILSYEVCDSDGYCDQANIALYIQFQNNAPLPEDDYLTVELNESRTGDVSLNDFDPDYLTDPVSVDNSFINISTPSNGTLTFNNDGTFLYTPNNGYTGTDSFTYVNCDACSVCATADVYITVIGNNDGPTATNSAIIDINEDEAYTASAAALATDPENDPLSFTVNVQPEHGIVVMNANGGFFYSPDAQFSGPDQFSFTACDIVGQCASAIVYINIISQNDPPLIGDELFTAAEDSPSISGNVSTNDSDDAPGLTYSLLSSPSHGIVNLQTSGSFTYVPEPNYSGSDTMLVLVCDAGSLCEVNTTVFQLTPVNDPPIIIADDLFGYEDQPYSGSIANDIDPDGDVLTYYLISVSPTFPVSISADGDVTINPSNNFAGFIDITYQVCDPGGLCNTWTLEFEVIEINDDPIINDDTFNGAEDQQVTGNIRTNDIEPDGEAIFYFNTTNPAHGSLLLNSDGTFVYTPDPNWSGAESINFFGCDPCSVCMPGTIQISITPSNDRPWASPGNGITTEDNELNSSLANLVTDIDGDAVSFNLLSAPAQGSVNISVSGSFTYQPSPNYSGSDSFTFTVCDNSGSCDTSVYTISISPVNDSPTAFPDENNTSEDMSTTGNVNNDTDIDDVSLNFTIITPPMNGIISMDPLGNYTYTPDANFNGVDMITYNVCDDDLASDAGTLVINISPTNDPPTALDDNNVTYQNNSLTGSLANNDSDIDGDIITYNLLEPATHGNFNLNSSGGYTYLPVLDYSGTDQIEYEVCDPFGSCASATLYITIFTTNTAPQANDISIITDEDNPSSGSLNAFVTDLEGGDMVFQIITPPSAGTINLLANGNYLYTPDADYSGNDTFSFQVCDTGNMCDSAAATIEILSVNDAPDVVDELIATPEDTGITFDLSANDSDQEGSALIYNVLVSAEHGIFTLSPAGIAEYQPDPNYYGIEVINYSACDNLGSCTDGILTINIASVNDSPAAINDTFSTNEDVPLNGSVSTNDDDVESGQLVFSILSSPASGFASISSNGNFTYTPSPNYYGTVMFDYSACDEGGLCAVANVTITIEPVNDPPTTSNDVRTINEDFSASGNLSLNDSDSDGDVLQYSIITDALYGIFDLTSDGEFLYTPNDDYYGSDFVLIEVCDNAGACNQSEFNVTILPVNDEPTILPEEFSTLEDVSLSGNLSSNDIDIDGDDLTYEVNTTAVSGTIEISQDGNFIYYPDPDTYGTETIEYTACDGSGACDTGILTINVIPANDAPTVEGEYQHVLEDSFHDDDLSLNDSDPDGDLLAYSILTGPGHGEFVLNNGSYTYTPDLNFWGLDSVTYIACDPSGLCNEGVIVFEVDFVNDAPIINDEIIQVIINETVYGSVALNDIELDFENLIYFIYQDNSNGIFTLNEDGTYMYTPYENVTGLFELVYYACDPCSVCGSGTITIHVVNIKDANTPPSAIGHQTSTCQDTAVDVDMTNLIADSEDDVFSLNIEFGNINSGEITLDPETRIMTYTPYAGNTDDVIIPYTVCDNGLVPMCDQDTIFIYIENVIPIAIDSFQITNVDCFGNSSGAIDIVDVSGTGLLQYLWNTNSESQDLDNLPTGDYSVIISSDALCAESMTYNFTVSGPESGLSATVTAATNISDFVNGSINIDITGGTSPYSVSWSGPEGFESADEDLDNLTIDGTYFATITDSNSCVVTLNNEITGIAEHIASVGIEVLPNPFTQEFTLVFDNAPTDNVQIELIDTQGRIVYRNKIASTSTVINPGEIASGCYQLRVTTARESKSISLIRR